MKFFDRSEETKKLKEIEQLSTQTAQFTVVTGRRRIGKTSLIREVYKNIEYLYFFVTRKAEYELCQVFKEEIEQKLSVPILGNAIHFSEIFNYVIQLSKNRPITLVIDEFQDFIRINPSVFSDMQKIWDLNKNDAKINLIVCGSVNSLMNKIFRDEKEPLFGRQTNMLKIRPFATTVLSEILETYNPKFTKEDLLALYVISGGVAKYVELMVDNKRLSKEQMLKSYFEKDSYFLNEGKSMLIEEFGKEYGIYFSILSLIAQGRNTRSEIEDLLNMEIGGYLTKLISDYELIAKHQPIFEKSANKNVRYAVTDPFLRFWFRFVFKYAHVIEAGGNDALLEKVKSDYSAYSGLVLEDYFRQRMIESGQYTRIGYWHDRKGNNEIDIIALNEFSNKMEIYEVKKQGKDVDLSILRSKTSYFLQSVKELNDYDISYQGLSMEDM